MTIINMLKTPGELPHRFTCDGKTYTIEVVSILENGVYSYAAYLWGGDKKTNYARIIGHAPGETKEKALANLREELLNRGNPIPA